MIGLPCFLDHRGSLTVAEEIKDIPFGIRRVYWITGVPDNAERGGHAHLSQHMVIVALAGSFTITLDNGAGTTTYTLDSPTQGLYIPPKIWSTLTGFSGNAVCLVLSSGTYDENDYLRDYSQFLKLTTPYVQI